MTRSQRSLSFLRNAANSAGVSVTTSAPSPLIRSTVSGRDKDLRISPASLLMIAAGVPAGASMPTQGAVASSPAKPASAMVGTPGKSALGLTIPSANALSFLPAI